MARTVLVVDDDLLVLDITAGMLEDLGCRVLTAASGAEALEQLADDRNIENLDHGHKHARNERVRTC
jgi:CheY-like chemotaxis protein